MTDNASEQSLLPDHTSEDPTSSPESNLELQFPQLLLQASFDSLLTHSYPSSSSTLVDMDPSDKSESSLGDSWTSLDDGDYEHEEDLQSETTDAGSLIDVHGSEDVHSISGDATPSEHEEEYENRSEDQPREVGSPNLTASESEHQTGPPTMRSSVVQSHEILLSEPEASRKSFVSLKHTLKIFSPEEQPRLKLDLPAARRGGDCLGTIHMTLSRDSLEANGRRSFRVLLFGKEYTPTLRGSILEKVADVLVAGESAANSTTSTSPARYHVVPDSFGPGSQPSAAEIIPIEWQLEVDQYHSALQGRNIILYNENTLARTLCKWTGSEYIVTDPHWSRPDLTIVCVDRNDEEEERLAARTMLSFARRSGLPVLVLRMDQDWNAQYDHFMFPNDQAHMCIETRPLSDGNVLRKLPIDLETFLNLNSGQLNRHFVWLNRWSQRSSEPLFSQAEQVHSDEKSTEKSTYSLMTTKLQQVQRDSVPYQQNIRRLLTVLAVVVLFGFAATAYSTLVRSFSTRALNHATTSSSLSLSPTFLPSALGSSSLVSVSHTLSTAPERSSSTLQVAIQSTEHFELEVVGDSHLIVRTPLASDLSRGKDNLLVTVLRDKKPIQTVVKKLFPRVYSVHLDPLEAFGEVEVSLAMIKPVVLETLKVDLGQRPPGDGWRYLLSETQTKLNLALALAAEKFGDLKESDAAKGVMDFVLTLGPKWKQETHNIKEIFQQYFTESGVLEKVEVKLHSVGYRFAARAGEIRSNIANTTQASSIRGKALAQDISTTIQGFTDFVRSLQQRLSFRQISEAVQEQTRSDTMATAQERAQRIIGDVKSRLKDRPRARQRRAWKVWRGR